MDQTVPSVFDELEEARPLPYATTGQRFLNYLIDLVVFYGAMYLVGIIYGVIALIMEHNPDEFLSNEEAWAKAVRYLVTYTLYVCIYTLSEGASKGKTLGKLITGTKAVKDDGSNITWKDALMRSLSRIVPFEPFSGFMGYPWHDKWNETRVIKNR